MKFVIASKNKGKIKEFNALLADFDIEIESLLDYPTLADVEETGTTFQENACLKSETIAEILQEVVIADDSGLCVDALEGAPGIYSARFAGEPSDSKRNNALLLEKLDGCNNRAAHFVCCLTVSHPLMPTLVVHGKVEGEILEKDRGTEGFGYDPLFYYPELAKTFAEMSSDEKNKVSHRAVALRNLMQELPKWLKELKKYEMVNNE